MADRYPDLDVLDLSPADRCRRAARQLRDAAAAASPSADPYPGGWSGWGTGSTPDDNWTGIYCGPAVDGYRTGVVLSTDPSCDACSGPSAADVAYITTVHPAVALAVADLLDTTAEWVGGAATSAQALTVLAIADQVLGVSAARALAEKVEDYDSGAGWQRVADAFGQYGVDAVLADPSLVKAMPEATT